MLSRRKLIASMGAGLLLLLQRAGDRARAKAAPLDAELFQTFRCDLAKHRLSLHWKRPDGKLYRSLRALKRQLESEGETVLALTNAGIYSRSYAPLGLHVEAGRELAPLNKRKGYGNFFLRPNGVFYIADGKAGVMRTQQFARRRPQNLQLATQSGPLLFDARGIHPRFLPKSTSTYIRNAVGVDKHGHVILVISRRPVTLWRLASFLRDEMHCVAGLYLDGAISALWRKGEPMPFAMVSFTGMIAVTEKQNAADKAG